MSFEIFCATVPGFEPALAAEMREAGFDGAITAGGVSFQGTWPDVWRANLTLRCASRVLARIASFRVFHLAQLDKRAHKVGWGDIFAAGTALKVDVTTRASKVYHAKAAAQRIEKALTDAGLVVSAQADLVLKVRIDDNLCVVSIDTSGEPLHIRGHKLGVGKAPMRETLAAAMLRECGYTGTEPLIDPMCGSGTFVIEGAEIATGLLPGRSRSFAFETLANFDPGAFAALKLQAARTTTLSFQGSDRDDGAVRTATQNAERAGVAHCTSFQRHAVSDLARPDGPPGLIMVNPPYGGRIGNKKLLYGLYNSLGQTLAKSFSGWRVGLVTSEGGLAKATGLPFAPQPLQFPHGGLRVALYKCDPLP